MLVDVEVANGHVHTRTYAHKHARMHMQAGNYAVARLVIIVKRGFGCYGSGAVSVLSGFLCHMK